MSKSQSTPSYDPGLLPERTTMLLRLLRGDHPSLTLDALISAYSSAAFGFRQADHGAHMLRQLADVLEKNETASAVQHALDRLPNRISQVPMPERPPGEMPPGYAAGDMERIEAMVRTILDLVEGEKGHNVLSVLLTCYVQVADHVGDTGKAAETLLRTGASILGRTVPVQVGAADPVPTTGAKPH